MFTCIVVIVVMSVLPSYSTVDTSILPRYSAVDMLILPRYCPVDYVGTFPLLCR
jgi:hypothetical protein